jgi:hypothetical protein
MGNPILDLPRGNPIQPIRMADRPRQFEQEWPDFVWAAQAVGARCDHDDNCEYDDDNYRRYDRSGHGD